MHASQVVVWLDMQVHGLWRDVVMKIDRCALQYYIETCKQIWNWLSAVAPLNELHLKRRLDTGIRLPKLL